MREILFRGKRRDNSEWETGSLVITRQGFSDEKFFITDKLTGYQTRVTRETIGQYTGLADKNGKKIFEGDIVKYNNPLCVRPLVIEWVDKYACFAFVDKGNFNQEHFLNDENCRSDVEIVGNIFDNPELLK